MTARMPGRQAADSWDQPYLRGIVILLATLVCYLPALRCGFVWDDGIMLTANPQVKALDGIFGIWRGAEGPDYFPLTYTSFWLEWHLWGLRPAGYHATNVLLHALGSLLLWRLLLRLRIPGAWWGALLFALHPVGVESVAWIAERKNTLAQVFYFLSLLAFLQSEEGEPRRYGQSVAFFALALLSKPSVVMLPVVLLLFAWWQRGRVERRDLLRSAPFFALSAAMALITVLLVGHRSFGLAAIPMGGPLDRLARAGYAAGFYLVTALAPFHLAAAYPPWSGSWQEPTAWLPLLALTLAFLICLRFRTTWGRPLLFALACFLVPLFPILGFFRAAYFRFAPVADHFQYLALPAATAAVAGFCAYAIARLDSRRQRAAAGAALVVIGLLGCLSWQRTGIFRSEETLWTATAAASPGSWLAQSNYAWILRKEGRQAESIDRYREAMRLAPDAPDPMMGVAWGLATSTDPALWNASEAIDLAQRSSVATGYKLPGFVDTLGAAYARAGRFPEARQHAELALLLARARDENEKVAGIQERLALYRRGIAYQEEKGTTDQSGATEMAAVNR